MDYPDNANDIYENDVDSDVYGIYVGLSDKNNNVIDSNTVDSNFYGIYLSNADGNIVASYHSSSSSRLSNECVIHDMERDLSNLAVTGSM